MSLRYALLSSALLLAIAPAAFAASDKVELTITGQIRPAACVPTLAGGGNIDLGTLSVDDLNVDDQAATALGTRTVNLTLACNDPVKIALQGTDNKANTASVAHADHYGLGTVTSGEKVGYYTVGFVPATSVIDGAAADNVMTSVDSGGAWTSGAGTVLLGNADTARVGFAKTSSETTPSLISTASIEIGADIYIAPSSTLPTAGVIDIDGHASITVVYL